MAEPRNYMTILEAIAHGDREPKAIATITGIAPPHVSKYLSALRDLRLVRREVPATVRRPERSRKGRYAIVDPYLRFYFRFLATRQDDIALGRVEAAWRAIRKHLIDFIGANTFEELCREWLAIEGDAGRLPFVPERVGSFWSPAAQVDVVAVSWEEKAILLAECKWSRRPVGKRVLDELIAKTSKVVPAGDWRIYHALFARAGSTPAAAAHAAENGATLVDLERLDRDLARVER